MMKHNKLNLEMKISINQTTTTNSVESLTNRMDQIEDNQPLKQSR